MYPSKRVSAKNAMKMTRNIQQQLELEAKRDREENASDISTSKIEKKEANIQVGLKLSEIKHCMTSFKAQQLPQTKSERESVYQAKKKIDLILRLTGAIFSFGQNISQHPNLHGELISSGFCWRALQFIFFNIQRDLVQLINYELGPIVNNINTNCAYILMNISSYASKSDSRGEALKDGGTTPRRVAQTVDLGKGNLSQSILE